MNDTHSNLRDNSARLKRNVSKIAFRSKEKVMRSFGRSEETKDEILEHYVMLINKQQIQMQKLQRDMKQYLSSLKAMNSSHKAFYTSLYEIYDNDWAGKDVIASLSQRSQELNDDIFARFQSEVSDVLQRHLEEYHDCKFRVEKRGRKLVDYDAARRSLHVLQSAKKPDNAKIEKAEEHLRQTRETYEQLNNQLHEQLPTLYDSRLPICVSTFSSLCESEKALSTEVAEMKGKLNNVLLNLKAAFDSGEYRIQRMNPSLDNGRVAPSTPSVVSQSSSKTSTSKPGDSAHATPHDPDDATPSSPKSDSSAHEYVNLQVGTMPDIVRPVPEEEENGVKRTQGSEKRGSKGKNDEGHTYLYPISHPSRDIGYIMANDPVLQRNRGPGAISHPKPSPRSQILRHHSDRNDHRPPAPQPLPRAPQQMGASPMGLRPTPQTLQGHWRTYQNHYTDVILKTQDARRKPMSLQRPRETSKPEPQSPPTKKANGDPGVIQPIYEEPPKEEDLPSYKQELAASRPEVPSDPKPPATTSDSQKYLDLPPEYLYSVQALYKYNSTDEDELSFEKGEIIHIITHPDPEEQDEGWQMGVRQKDWEQKADFDSSMGVFPENFTKRIQL